MERGEVKKQKSLTTQVRECLGKPQNDVPVDIWKFILRLNIRCMAIMAQTCKTFEQVVKEIRTNNYILARQYRAEGQIRLARDCLVSCVEHNHTEATFQLGYAHCYGGWGVDVSSAAGSSYLTKAEKLGSEYALVVNYNIKSIFIDYKRLTIPFVCGYAIFKSTQPDYKKVIEYFEISTQQGDELGQYYLGFCYYLGLGTAKNTDKAKEWYTKSAEQGFYGAQYILGAFTSFGKDPKWLRKAKAQNVLY